MHTTGYTCLVERAGDMTSANHTFKRQGVKESGSCGVRVTVWSCLMLDSMYQFETTEDDVILSRGWLTSYDQPVHMTSPLVGSSVIYQFETTEDDVSQPHFYKTGCKIKWEL